MESKVIELTGCKVTLKPFVDRKTSREYSAAMYEGITCDLEGDVEVKIPLANLERANDILVLNMIQSVQWDGKQVGEPATEGFLDRVKQSDFIKVLKECNAMIQEKEEKKSESFKSSKTG